MNTSPSQRESFPRAWGLSWIPALMLLVWGCSSTPAQPSGEPRLEEGEAEARVEEVAVEPGPSCPVTAPAPDVLPGTKVEHLDLAYWLEQTAASAELDEVLLSASELRDLHEAINQPSVGNALGQQQLLGPVDERRVAQQVEERLEWLYERFASGAYVEPDGSPVEGAALARFEVPEVMPPLRPELRVTLALTPVRCGPREEPFYKPDLNQSFDRNGCSAAHPQEVIQVLARWPDGMMLARTRYTIGWIAPDTPLSPPIPTPDEAEIVDAPKHRLLRALTLRLPDGESVSLAADTLLPAAGGRPEHAWIASPSGVHAVALPADALMAGTRDLTRRALLTEAFSYLGGAYGFGGLGGGRDCSRFLLDTFAAFGVQLPRHSANQARAGSFSIDVSGVSGEPERLALLDAAFEHGVVLLQFPGHIMLYLGRDDAGQPMAIHAFAEYLEPCAEGTENDAGETLLRVGRVDVSNLELGRGTSRTAFIERITRVTVIGPAAGLTFQGIAEARPPAPLRVPDDEACVDSTEHALFLTPERPSREQRLRVISTQRRDPGPAELVLVSPTGERIRPPLRALGGPPFTRVATLDAPAPGRWKAVYGDGRRTLSCATFEVAEEARSTTRDTARGPFWEARQDWDPAYEDLYAAFVESLFDYPVEEDRTWDNLHEILQDADRNLLYGHLGADEESGLKLQPDCADLPYFLRAYFAWKMRLPFGYRSCSRGRSGRPPTCNDAQHNLMRRSKTDEVRAFVSFANALVRNAVHSASGRTAPEDSDTDYYPIPLTREALLPGTLFADPYGHLLVLTRWVPQGLDSYGVLIAADAQPDGTVGRRRFWQGSFLFTADTTDVGAGFKAFRPLVREGSSLEVLDNEALRATQRHTPFSDEQYAGDAEDFYVAMEGLINPRPLDPFEMQRALIEALDESVARRVNSVQNGEEWKEAHRGQTIGMPKGHAIFETTGPWEAYSTPSRDMRLLISLDTVLNFPERVRRAPHLFALDASRSLDEIVEALRDFQREELEERTFTYERSDGSPWTLSLHDVVDRMVILEVSYNPNDCVEIRWAASPDSEEASTCDERAPRAHQKRMERYRSWFATRTRPPR